MMDKRSEDNEKIQKRQDAPRLPAKAFKIMESRRRTLYIQGLVDWVEDALHNVTRQFLGCNGESRTSDYLRMAYPRDFPEEKRRNSTGDERKTLRYRFRYMFRCLMLIADRYEEFEQWKFTGLECMMEIFEEVVRQALGAAVADRFHAFYWRFRGLWKTVNPALNSKDDVYAELCGLMDAADIVFEDMFMECVSRETAREKGTNPDMGEAVEAMQEVAEECREATREQRHAAKLVAKVAGVALVRRGDREGYGRYEGLETLNANRRAEVKAAIDMSHRDYPVVRKPRCRADPTLGKLAQRCWKANRDAFEKLAKLPREPGYKDEKAFRVTLYALARNYPAADHFRWMTSTAEPAKKVGEKHLNETANCGTISNMAKGFKNATLALALTAVGVMASCRASGASPDISRGGGGYSPQSCVELAYARPSAGSRGGMSANSRPRQTQATGKVIRVADGDTITILDPSNTQLKIRLNKIDAPEKSQAFGQRSKQHLSDIVFGRSVTVTWDEKDRYGRILGTVWLDGRDINLQMVRDGFAWHYKRYDSTPAYAQAEADARAARRGLWVDPDPTPPEQFRHGGGAAPRAARANTPSSSAASSTTREEYFAGRTMPVGKRTPAPICDKWPDTGYWLSTNFNKRHNRRCENYRKTRGYPCRKNEGSPCGKCGG